MPKRHKPSSDGPFRLMSVTAALLFLLCVTASASNPLPLTQYEHKNWAPAEGAPANAISLIQDGRGLLWFTSPSGVYTFNGLNFVPFAMPPEIDPAVAVIFSLSVAPSGNIWGASRVRGLICIDPAHHVTAYGPAEGLPAHPVNSITEDAHGEVWAIADGNLYHLLHHQWRDETRERGLLPGEVSSDFFDRQGVHWIASKTTVFVLPPGKEKALPLKEQWAPGHVDLLEDPRGALWAIIDVPGGTVVCRQLDAPGHPIWFRKTIPAPGHFVDARFDRFGTLWMTGTGLDRVTFAEPKPAVPGTDEPSFELQHFGVAEGLSSDSTRWLWQDTQGDMWVATMHGLDRFRVPTLVKASLPIVDSSTLPDLAPGIAGQVWLGSRNGPLYKVEGDRTSAFGPALDSYLCLFQDRELRTLVQQRKATLA